MPALAQAVIGFGGFATAAVRPSASSQAAQVANTLIPIQPPGLVIGQTSRGETVTISKALYRWLMVDLLKRVGGVSAAGFDGIAADAANALLLATQASTDITALDLRLDSAEADIVALYAADTALDARVDVLEAALAEMNMNYATRLDQDASPPTFSYFGIAAVGSAEASAVWRIKKMVFGLDGDVTVTWADGDDNFDNVWTNRAALSYS